MAKTKKSKAKKKTSGAKPTNPSLYARVKSEAKKKLSYMKLFTYSTLPLRLKKLIKKLITIKNF